MTASFEDLVGEIPAGVEVTDAERGELLILARSADREAEHAKAGDEDHQLGVTMARFLTEFATVVGRRDPEAAERIVEELREAVDEHDARAVKDFTSKMRNDPRP